MRKKDVKRKYYYLTDEVIQYIKICALQERTNEHTLVNNILYNYKKGLWKKPFDYSPMK